VEYDDEWKNSALKIAYKFRALDEIRAHGCNIRSTQAITA